MRARLRCFSQSFHGPPQLYIVFIFLSLRSELLTVAVALWMECFALAVVDVVFPVALINLVLAVA